mgnify:CR=1 FL=1
MSEIKFSKTDFIGYYTDVFAKEHCKELRNYIDTLYDRSFLVGEKFKAGSHVVDHYTANLAQHYDLPVWNWLSRNIQSRMATCVNHYMREFSVLNRTQLLFVDFKVKKILPGGGFHNWHYENGKYEHALRGLVVQIYLNDNFEGGETEFLYINKRIEAKEGAVLIFPPGFTHTHRGNPPIGGTKYIVGTWGTMKAHESFNGEY